MAQGARICLHAQEYVGLLQKISLAKVSSQIASLDNLLKPSKYTFFNRLDGIIYFVEGKGVGSEFGFPRVTTRKKFRWKKMNFTTELPKKDPQVTYVVASAVKSHRMDHSEHPLYRMHAVVLYGSEK
jgi:hypothetical protein